MGQTMAAAVSSLWYRKLVDKSVGNTSRWRLTAWLLLGSSITALGCRSSMRLARDAGADGATVEASGPASDTFVPTPDVADDARDDGIDAPSSMDALFADLSQDERLQVLVDSAPTLVTPKAFRFDNHSGRTAYVPSLAPVECRTQGTSGAWQACSFFAPLCTVSCTDAVVGQSCCEMCDVGPPRLLPVPPGGSRTVVWNGAIFNRKSAICSACSCHEEVPAPTGRYQVSALVYASYHCETAGCSLDSEGGLVGASPEGVAMALAVPFAIPAASDVVVLAIDVLPPDAFPPAFAALLGGTFEIAASNTPPDASVQGSETCKPVERSAHYNLLFSPDGLNVRIVRADPVQEQIISATLSIRSQTRFVYAFNSPLGGGELIVEDIGGSLTAQFVIFGSGVPVVSCIESPMTKV